MNGRQAVIAGVRPAGVVETGDIGDKTLLELRNGLEAAPVQFLLFQVLEKALHDSVVIRVTFGRKGLDHARFIDNLAEDFGSKRRTLICMEYDAIGNTPRPYSIPQGANCRETVNFAANPAGDDLVN